MTDASDRRSASRRRAGTADAADEPHILALSKTQASSLRDVLESIVSEVRGRVEGAGARVRVTDLVGPLTAPDYPPMPSRQGAVPMPRVG